jgi:hypothetical protein
MLHIQDISVLQHSMYFIIALLSPFPMNYVWRSWDLSSIVVYTALLPSGWEEQFNYSPCRLDMTWFMRWQDTTSFSFIFNFSQQLTTTCVGCLLLVVILLQAATLALVSAMLLFVWRQLGYQCSIYLLLLRWWWCAYVHAYNMCLCQFIGPTSSSSSVTIPHLPLLLIFFYCCSR